MTASHKATGGTRTSSEPRRLVVQIRRVTPHRGGLEPVSERRRSNNRILAGRTARLIGSGCKAGDGHGRTIRRGERRGYDRGFGHVSREFIPASCAPPASPPASGCSMSPPAPGLRPRRLSRRSGPRAMWLRRTYSPPCWRRPARASILPVGATLARSCSWTPSLTGSSSVRRCARRRRHCDSNSP